MASNGLVNRAKNGTCRICHRTRNVERYLKAVGEISHGYATGHIWECVDEKDCDAVAAKKLESPTVSRVTQERIRTAIKEGRFRTYQFRG